MSSVDSSADVPMKSKLKQFLASCRRSVISLKERKLKEAVRIMRAHCSPLLGFVDEVQAGAIVTCSCQQFA